MRMGKGYLNYSSLDDEGSSMTSDDSSSENVKIDEEFKEDDSVSAVSKTSDSLKTDQSMKEF